MKLLVEENIKNIRLDFYLTNYLVNLTRSKIQNEIKRGNILVNKKIVKPSYLIKENDEIVIQEIENKIIKPENVPLNIVWEDENMLVVNKPSGMLTHPTNIEMSGTLVNSLLYHYGENLSNINGDFRPGIIHRLDRNTSGLLMIAKNNDTHNFLAEKMKTKQVEKKYLAVVKGVVKEDNFIIDKPIGRNPKQPHKMCVIDSGKESISIVKVLKRYKDASLLEVQIITGRTHQIRVHLSSIGHVIYNDSLYGFGKSKIKTDEQVLQSYKLKFPKPFTEEIIELEIEKDEKLLKVIKFLNDMG